MKKNHSLTEPFQIVWIPSIVLTRGTDDAEGTVSAHQEAQFAATPRKGANNSSKMRKDLMGMGMAFLEYKVKQG